MRVFLTGCLALVAASTLGWLAGAACLPPPGPGLLLAGLVLLGWPRSPTPGTRPRGRQQAGPGKKFSLGSPGSSRKNY